VIIIQGDSEEHLTCVGELYTYLYVVVWSFGISSYGNFRIFESYAWLVWRFGRPINKSEFNFRAVLDLVGKIDSVAALWYSSWWRKTQYQCVRLTSQI